MEVQSIQHYLQSNGWEHKRPNWQSIESESPGVCNSSAVVVVSSQLPFVKPSLSSPMHLSQSMRAITRGSRQAVCLSARPWYSLSHLWLQRAGREAVQDCLKAHSALDYAPEINLRSWRAIASLHNTLNTTPSQGDTEVEQRTDAHEAGLEVMSWHPTVKDYKGNDRQKHYCACSVQWLV
jgi:hypothetical protein